MTQPVLTDPLVGTLFTHCRWYELALRRHGFTPDRLMYLARKSQPTVCVGATPPWVIALTTWSVA